MEPGSVCPLPKIFPVPGVSYICFLSGNPRTWGSSTTQVGVPDLSGKGKSGRNSLLSLTTTPETGSSNKITVLFHFGINRETEGSRKVDMVKVDTINGECPW